VTPPRPGRALLDRTRGSIVSGLLTPLSWAYGGAALIRRRWWEKRAVRLECPVISVGNITCGGTGKTPVVEMAARDLLGLGRRPAILTRGYRAPRGSDANDEMLVLSRNLPDVPQFRSADRRSSGREAIGKGADVLILDDGFQHAKLARDLDIVLIDALSPFGGGRVLPAGLLREPLSVLDRAHLFGITRWNRVQPRTLATLASYLRGRFPRTPHFLIESHALGWVTLAGEESPAGSLRGERALVFCAIGNPEAFRRDVLTLGVDIAELVPFRDHHAYTCGDIERLARRAEELCARTVIMTQKDAVKVPVSTVTGAWSYLRIESRIARGADAYASAMEGALRR
jgi:tetraacyldisaccharide 4'-kinase